MKKITILALHLGYGGIEKYLSSLTNMLKNEYDIKIISTYKLYDTPPFDFDGVEIEYLTSLRPLKDELINSIKTFNILGIFKYSYHNLKTLLFKYIKNIKAIKNIDSDYIITTRDFHNNLVRLYANKDIVKIATEHNHHNNNKKYISKVTKSIRDFDYLVLVSKELKKYYTPLVSPTRCLYIPNVIDEIAPSANKLKKYNLISIGRISPEKGFDDLILIMEKLVKINKKYHLDLIGDGPDFEKINNLILDKKLEKNITMHGYLNQDKIKDIITNDSLYVMTSHTESFGIVLIEAMSYGIPCIAYTSARGACELITQKNMLIKNRNIDKMVSTIDSLMNDTKRLKTYGKNNYDRSQLFLSSNVVNEWKKLFK